MNPQRRCTASTPPGAAAAGVSALQCPTPELGPLHAGEEASASQLLAHQRTHRHGHQSGCPLYDRCPHAPTQVPRLAQDEGWPHPKLPQHHPEEAWPRSTLAPHVQEDADGKALPNGIQSRRLLELRPRTALAVVPMAHCVWRAQRTHPGALPPRGLPCAALQGWLHRARCGRGGLPQPLGLLRHPHRSRLLRHPHRSRPLRRRHRRRRVCQRQRHHICRGRCRGHCE
mmetsp:Transcript_160905/g.516415  ORF Transcript_160905/g.516415 Transcript_160905/m.516415 type:complete len:228 (+) Transcript_160905:1118-1801(+)